LKHRNTSTGSVALWLTRLLRLLVVCLLGAILVIIGALIFLDGDDYKPLFAWVAATFFDSELQINGPLRVHVSGGLELDAAGVRLKARDDSYLLAADTLRGDIRLRDAISGTLWVRDLALTGFYLRINESESPAHFDWKDFTLPPVIVERASFENLRLEYQEVAPGTLHSFTLSELAFDDVNDTGPVSLQAKGVLEGRSFSLDGSFPPLEQALDQKTPKPVVMTLTGEKLQAHLDGTITDPVNGKGMDFKLEFQAPEVHELLEIFGDDIPTVGELQAAARLQGDYAVPRLVDIDATMHREKEVEITLTGSVDDILTGAGMNLHLVGHSDHPAVTSWLLFKRLDMMEILGFDGLVQENNGHFYLKELDASAKTSAGLALTASGEGELYDKGHVFSATDAGIDLKVTAPTTQALNLLELDDIPELGAISGILKLMVSRDAIGLYDADVNIGSRKTSTANLKGQVGYIPLHDASATTGIDLKVNIKSTDVAALGSKLGYAIQPLGPGHVDTRVTGKPGNIRLGGTVVSIGRKDGLLIAAKGKADSIVFGESGLQASADFAVTASMPDLSELSGLAGTDLPELGATAISSRLVIRNSELKFENLMVNIGAANQPTIRLNGKVATMLPKGSTVSVNFDVAVGDLVAALTGNPPDYLGRMQGTADLSDVDGSWGVEKFTLVSSNTRLYQVNIGGGYKDLQKSDFIKVNTKIDINDPVALGKALDLDLSGFSAWHTEGTLTGTGTTLSYTSKGSVGRTASTTTITGSLLNGRPYFRGSFEIPVLYLSDFGFNPKEENTESVKVDLDNPGSGDIFSREPFDIDFLNTLELDIDFLIDQVESHDQLTIDSINAHIHLKDGNLKVDPLKFLFEGGTMDVVFGLQAGNTPAFQLQVTADDVKLGPMMAQVQNDVPINGYTNLDMDVAASGLSPHDLAASLDGKVHLGFENVRVPKKYIQFLSVDLLGWAVSRTFEKNKYADLNCVVATFEASDGKVKSTVLIADGPDLSLGGRIDLNLARETMKIVLLPKQKHRLFSSISPVTIKGPMRAPRVEAIPSKAAIQEIGGMALVPYVYVPIQLLGKLWSIVDDGDGPGEGCSSIKAVSEEAEKQLLKEAQK
jgi:uncharacterized protein involved in outer membrane biogenesis